MIFGEWVAGTGAGLLLLSLFAPWEHRPTSNPALIETRNGWLALGVLAAALAAAAAVPLWHLVRRVRGRPLGTAWGRLGLGSQASLAAGAAAVTAIISALAFRMGIAVVPGGGLDVGLAAAGLMTVGGAVGVWLTPSTNARGRSGPTAGMDDRAGGQPVAGSRPRVDSGGAQRSRARSLRGRRAGGAQRRPGS